MHSLQNNANYKYHSVNEHNITQYDYFSGETVRAIQALAFLPPPLIHPLL